MEVMDGCGWIHVEWMDLQGGTRNQELRKVSYFYHPSMAFQC